MSDGKVIYHVRADHSKVDEDMRAANSKVKSGAEGFSKTMKTMITGAAIATVAKEVVQLGSAFETSLAGASTLFGDVNVDMNQLSDDMLKLSNSTGVAADELGNSLYNALSAGVPATEDMSEALDLLEKSSRLAKAGFTDVDTALGVTTSVLNSYRLGVEETDNIQKMLIETQNKGVTTVDELGRSLGDVLPTASAANVGFDEISASLATMTASMGKGSTPKAVTALKSMLAELANTGSKTSTSLEAATEAAFGTSKTFSELQQEGYSVSDTMQILASYATDTGLSMYDLVGSQEAVQAALLLTGENSETFSNNLAAMSTQTDVVGDAFDKVTSTSAEQFNKAINELKNSAIELYLQLLPLIAEILPVLIEIFKALAPPILEIVKHIIPPLLIILKSLGEFISVVLTPVISWLGKIFADVFGEIAKIAANDIGRVAKVLSGIIDFVRNVFTGNWRAVWQSIKNIFSGVVSGLGGIFKSPINSIINSLNSFIRGVNRIKIPDWVPVVGGRGINLPTLPRLRVGLDYVPDDEFPAVLHKGEAVLTAREAGLYRSLGGNLESVLAMLSASAKATSGMGSRQAQPLFVETSLYLDGREIARGSTEYVLEEINKSIDKSRGWNF